MDVCDFVLKIGDPVAFAFEEFCTHEADLHYKDMSSFAPIKFCKIFDNASNIGSIYNT